MEEQAPEVARARASFAEHGSARIDGALEHGLAAELVALLPRFAPAPRLVPAHVDLSWACEIAVPCGYDPQHPACLYRLVEVLDRRLPALASAVVGRALEPMVRRRVHVWMFRRGAYVDDGKPLAPAGGVDVVVGLTAARWPAAWGGHLEIDGAPSRALGFGTIDLIGARGYRVPLVTRHVEALAVRSVLVPA